MKHLAISLTALVMLLASCKTTKKTSENINQERASSINTITSTELTNHIESLWNYSRSEATQWGSITTITIYDTSKPADPETGNPPIYAEISRQDSAKTSAIETESSVSTDSTQIKVVECSDIDEHEISKQNTKTSTKSKPLSSTISFKIIIALLLIIGVLIAYLKYKRDG